MNLTSFIAAALLLSSSASLVAADKSVDTSKPPRTAKTNKADKHSRHRDAVLVTGSHLPRDVRRNGLVTIGPNPVYILDSSSIQNSGATDLSQLLTHRGFRR